MESLVAQEPALNARMLVGRVVIANQIDFLLGRDRPIDHAQEAEPFLMAMPLLAESIDFAGGGIEGSEQGRCAVALVIVRHGGAPAFFIGRPGCVRSSAWIWLFSSTLNTSACSGGFRYSPTIASSFSAN